MVGAIGNLQPDKPEFKEYLDRYHRNRLFLGIRYGNLWNYNLVEQVANPPSSKDSSCCSRPIWPWTRQIRGRT